MFDRLRRLALRLQSAARPPHDPASDQRTPLTTHVRPRVLMIVHNPPVAGEGGRRLNEIFRWNDPQALVDQYAADLEACSGGYVRYQIVERIDADWFPLKRDGFRYTGEDYVQRWRHGQMHQPDAIDYESQIAAFDLIGRYERGEMDEVWFVTFPYAGDYESTMVGHNAFWCNSPPVPNSHHCRGRFILMGFSYERGVDCMLENFGHRVESIMRRVYANHPADRNMWERFIRYEQVAPGAAECGNVHFAPNSERDYDWGNPRSVVSYCDDWFSYPQLPRRARIVDRTEWGGGDMRAHHLWWLRHLPRAEGSTDGVANNWWRYVVDPNTVDA